jgi:hypothetical protein
MRAELILHFVPEPVLTDEQRSELRAALATPETWAAHLAALPCPDCIDGDCSEHAFR